MRVLLPDLGAFGVQVDFGLLEGRRQLEERAEGEGLVQVGDFAQSVFEVFDFNELLHPDGSHLLLAEALQEVGLFELEGQLPHQHRHPAVLLGVPQPVLHHAVHLAVRPQHFLPVVLVLEEVVVGERAALLVRKPHQHGGLALVVELPDALDPHPGELGEVAVDELLEAPHFGLQVDLLADVVDEQLGDVLPLGRRLPLFLLAGLNLVEGEAGRVNDCLAEPGAGGLEVVLLVNGVLALAEGGQHTARRELIISEWGDVY